MTFQRTAEPRSGMASEAALLDSDEAASRLNCSRALIRKLIQTNKLEHVKVGSLVRVEPAAIERYIEAHRQPAAS